MIEIDNILISDDVVEKHFVCDLTKCKGGCCVEGDAGAPVTKEEAAIIKELYPQIKQDLLPQAIEEIENVGTTIIDDEFDIVTPTIEGGICVYGYYDEDSIVKCAIEKAFYEGKTDFKKPISCHLFPIKITKSSEYDFVNYDPRPKLCKPGCKLGESLKVPVYEFLKEPLVRLYGEEFYEMLESIAEEYY